MWSVSPLLVKFQTLSPLEILLYRTFSILSTQSVSLTEVPIFVLCLSVLPEQLYDCPEYFFLYPFPWNHTNNILLADSFESPLSCSLPMLTYENQSCIIIFPIEATWNESQIHILVCLCVFIASVPGIDLRRKNNYSWFSAYIWHIL